MDKKGITIIGSGISGILCALKFNLSDYKVRVISKSPSFETYEKKVDFFSSTLNGEVGRFFTTFEGHPYIGNSSMYPDMKDAFKKRISKGGWLGKDLVMYDKDERKWLENRWLANENALNYSEKFDKYVDANSYSIKKWREYSLELKMIFENTDFYDGHILRLYNSKDQLNFAIDLHKKYGVLKSILNVEEVADKHILFRESCYNGFFAGGIEVTGQTINIKQFSINLIKYLIKNGVEFIFDTEITKINKDKNNKVVSVSTNTAEIRDKNFLFCTGAYHEKGLFKNTPAKNKFGGVAGKWFLIPKIKEFHTPTKVHIQLPKAMGGHYPVIDFNFAPYFDKNEGQYLISIGGGYVFSGNPPFENIGRELRFIDALNEKALEMTIGSLYRKYFDSGELIFSDAICHRSFSFDDTPVFDKMNTINGGKLIITGGTNTGTATMSPYISNKVFDMIEN